MSVKPSRRQLLKTAALTSGGISLDLASTAHSANAQSATSIKVDCCVVGAGYAGLTAALRLHQAGRSVAVLEARDRVGGRIWSAPLSDGTAIDIGGHWVGPSQRHILALAQEMQVPIFDSYTAGDVVYLDDAGKAVRDLPAPVATELADALQKLDAMAAEVPLETPWLAPQAAAWDLQTIGGWLAANVKTPYVRNLLAVAVLGSIGPVAPEQSLLWALFAFHAAGGLTTMLTDEDAQAIEGGAQAVALKVAAALGDQVQLNSPVRKITQDARGVDVTADAMVVRARRVIVTVPRTLAGAIRFDPILPADAAQLIQRIPMGSVIKATLVYDEAFWRKHGLSGGSLNVGSPVSSTADGGLATGQDQPGLLIAFIGAESARAVGRMSPAERQKIVVGECVKLFGPKAAELSQSIVFPRRDCPISTTTGQKRNGRAATMPPFSRRASSPDTGPRFEIHLVVSTGRAPRRRLNGMCTWTGRCSPANEPPKRCWLVSDGVAWSLARRPHPRQRRLRPSPSTKSRPVGRNVKGDVGLLAIGAPEVICGETLISATR